MEAPVKVPKRVVHIAPCKGMPLLASERKSWTALSPVLVYVNILWFYHIFLHIFKTAVSNLSIVLYNHSIRLHNPANYIVG